MTRNAHFSHRHTQFWRYHNTAKANTYEALWNNIIRSRVKAMERVVQRDRSHSHKICTTWKFDSVHSVRIAYVPRYTRVCVCVCEGVRLSGNYREFESLQSTPKKPHISASTPQLRWPPHIHLMNSKWLIKARRVVLIAITFREIRARFARDIFSRSPYYGE